MSMLALLSAALLGAGAARADEFQFTSYQQIGATLQQQEQEIGQLRAELASLRRELAEGAAPVPAAAGAITYSQGCCNGGCCDSCCNGDCGCCNSCCDSCVCDNCCGMDALAYQTGCGWYAFGELMILQPLNQLGTNAIGSFNPELAPRVTLGWVGDCGFGIRARYWQFHQSAPGPGAGQLDTIRAHTIDLEATDRICLGKWIATGAVGLRYVNWLETGVPPVAGRVAAAVVGANGRNRFEGLGLTLAADFVRPFACEWSFYANTRYSVLGGNFDYGTGGATRALRGIAEIGAGLQYDRDLGNGISLLARAGVEAQYWQGFGSPNLGVAGFVSDAGFLGLTSGVGFAY